MLISFVIIGTIVFTLFLIKINLNYQFKKTVKTLLSESKPIPGQKFSSQCMNHESLLQYYVTPT